MKKKFTSAMRLFVISAIFLIGASSALCTAQPNDELFVFADGATHIMQRVASASGERYEAPDDPETVFLSDGTEATLKIRGRLYSRYVLLRSLADDGEFLDEFLLTVDGKNYRMKQVVSASGAAYEAVDDPDTTFRSKGPSATLVVRGKEYSGYDTWQTDGGIWLADQEFPTEIEWNVTNIADSAVLPDSTVTLTFHADGSLSGLASVNHYNALWMTSGGEILITKGTVTKKMGPPDLMNQEGAFLRLLPEIKNFQFRKDGLALGSKSGAKIILKR
jgi:heat shock protein HslJ/membrane-bound inhibitor of C-type lysozyme